MRETPARSPLALAFEWAPARSAFEGVTADRLTYRFRGFPYAVRVAEGVAAKTPQGATVTARRGGAIRLMMARRS